MKNSAVLENKQSTASVLKKEGISRPAEYCEDARGKKLAGIIARSGFSCNGRRCGHSLSSLAKGITGASNAQRKAIGSALQKPLGNRFMQGLSIQAKLMISPADDPYEKEADRVAEQVMAKTADISTIQNNNLHRKGIISQKNASGQKVIQQKKSDFSDDILDHIFIGKISQGAVAGFHSENENRNAIAQIARDGKRERFFGGVYKSDQIHQKGNPNVRKNGFSTFYPISWSRETVKEAIERSTEGNYEGITGSANREVNGPLPGLDEKHSILLNKAGDTIYPVGTGKQPNRKEKK